MLLVPVGGVFSASPAPPRPLLGTALARCGGGGCVPGGRRGGGREGTQCGRRGGGRLIATW